MTEETDVTGAAAELSSLQVGEFEVTYIPDGIYLCEAAAQYPNVPEEGWRAHPGLFDAEGWLVMSLGAVLIRGGGTTVLVDAGIGPISADVAELAGGRRKGRVVGGQLIDNLAAVGVQPDDIDAVALTHLHIDHIGGVCLANGRSTFPRARMILDRAEWAHRSEGEPSETASAHHLAAIGVHLELVTGPTQIAPGIHTFPTPGHSPGHNSLLISSQGVSALVLGDAIHLPIEFEYPEVSIVFDHDPERARASRARIADRLLQPDTWLVGGHFPTTVFGTLERTPSGVRVSAR
jgi:glyoxylase-like metal-dependent hydrolase (beta-lactamase superfamily II)